MSHIDDVVTGGILPLQHHDTDYELPLRVVKYGARYGGKSASKKDTIVKGTAGDLLGGILWPFNPGLPSGTATGSTTAKTKREIPAWGFGFPCVSTAASRKVGKIHRVKVRPVGDDALNQDPRFKELDVLTPAPVASGQHGVLMAATEEYSQIEVFLPSASELKAPHFGKPGSAGTLVYDLDQQGKLDPDRKATLQHLTRVHQIPEACTPLYGTPGTYGLALQLDLARDGQLGGLIADGVGPPQRLAHLGKKTGGPLFTGFPGDKHDHGQNKDGENYGPVHVQGDFLLAKDPFRDGPIDLKDEIITDLLTLPGVDVETRMAFNPLLDHPTPCGPKKGRWQFVTRVPFYQPPPPTITEDPRTPEYPGDTWTPKIPEDPRTPRDPGGPGRPIPGGEVTDGPMGPRGNPTGPVGPDTDPPEDRPRISTGFGGPRPGPTDGPTGGGFVGPDSDPPEEPRRPATPRTPTGFGGPRAPSPRPPTDGPSEGSGTDPCRKRPVSTLNEWQFPGQSWQAPNQRTGAKDYLYDPKWGRAEARQQAFLRPTVLRTDVIAKNLNGSPTLTRKKPCPYPGGTASGWVVDYPPEEGIRDGPMAGGSSTSGRAACRTKTGHGCPNDDGTFTGYTTDNVAGVLTIDLVTSDVTTGTAKLELGPGYLKLNGTAFAAGGLSLFFGDAEDDGVYV